MSDPISLTGTAVGVVSFGLQVCGEIVSYCQAWRGFDRDIQTFAQKADGVRIPLEVLRGLFANFQALDVATSRDIEEKLKHIDRVIKRLKEATDKYASKGSGDTAAIRAQFRKARYPFHKDGLRDMSSDLDSLQLSLHTILHALSIQHAQTLITMQQATAQNLHDMSSSIQDIREQLIPPLSSPNLRQDHHSQVAIIPEPSLIRRDCSSTDSPYLLRSHVNFKRQSKATTKTYSHSVRMLRLAINFTLSVTLGTGLSIAPSLSLQPLRDARSSRVLEALEMFAMESRLYSTMQKNLEDLVTATITQVQGMFDRGEATPFDVFAYSGTAEQFSTLDFTCLRLDSGSFLASSRLLQFLVNCGASPARVDSPSIKDISWKLSLTGLLAGEHEIGGRLLNLYGYVIQPPRSLAQKEGLRWLIRQDYDDTAIPDIAKAIIRESEYDLREAIEAKPHSINDKIGSCSLLELAFGWPTGIQILLKAGADASAQEINFLQDTKYKSTYDSVKLLLQAGCRFSFRHIVECNRVVNGDDMRSLLIGELIARLKRLWELAKSSLPSEELPTLFMNEDTDSKNPVTFDVWATQIRAKLACHSITVDPSLQTPNLGHWSSVYHYPLFSPQIQQVFYDFGFRGVNEPDLYGLLPLMTHGSQFCFVLRAMEVRRVMDRLAWLISKDADPNQLVPGTSSTVAHHLTYWIFGFFKNALRNRAAPFEVFSEEWKKWKDVILESTKSLTITPSSGDECICACSPGGCSTISLLLRQAFECLFPRPSKLCQDARIWLREMVAFVFNWIGQDQKVCQAVLRFFTFDALGLRHVCCVEEQVRNRSLSKLVNRDRQEAEEILDEEKLGQGDLERLVAEFEERFDELGLPIMDFLQGYWYSRMIDFLSERDPYNEEHIFESKKIGVKLEAEEWVLPDRVSLLIRPDVEEIIERFRPP